MSFTGYTSGDLNTAHLGEWGHVFIHLLAIPGIHDYVQGVLRFSASRSLDIYSELACVVFVEMGKKHLAHFRVSCRARVWTAFGNNDEKRHLKTSNKYLVNIWKFSLVSRRHYGRFY